MKIRNRVFINLFVVAVFAVAVVVGVIYFFGRQIVVNNIASYNYLLAQSDIDSVDRFIDRRLEYWQSYVASNSELFKTLGQSNTQFATMPGRDAFIATQDSAWQKSEKNTITPFMKAILENPTADDLHQDVAFYAKRVGYDIFPEVFITNKYGVLIAATDKTSDYLQSDEAWWQNAIAEGVWAEDVSLDVSSGVNSLAFCIRINDEKGDFVGVAKVIYDIRDISTIVGSITKPSETTTEAALGFTRKTVAAVIFTKDGKLIYSTKIGFGNLADSTLFASTHKMNMENHAPFVITTVDGVEKLFSHGISRGSGDFKGLGWILMIEKNTDEVLAPLTAVFNWLFLFIILFLVGVIMVAIWLSYSFNKPIRKLMGYVAQVGRGDLNVKMESIGRDELGQLAESFSDMVQTVKRSRREVDAKVAAQTKEIKEKADELAKRQTAIINVLEDVDAEKNKLVLAKAQDEAILTGIGDGVFVLDTERRIRLFNPMAEKISGFSVQEALGKKYDKILQFIFEKGGAVNDAFINESIVEGRIAQMANHTMLIRKDGTKLPVADSAAPIKDSSGKITGCVVVFRDVTKEREVDQMKSEFVSVASHQLRTPLTGIKWFSELLLKSKVSAKTREYVSEIVVSTERMVHLVDDLLNVSRIETGRKFDIILKHVDVVPIVKSVLEEQMPGAIEKKVKLTCAAQSPEKLVLSIDELKMRQVFQNLVNNSIKYSRVNTKIEFGCNVAKDEVTFYVKDNGIGIPKKQQDQIFNKFFRAENVFTVHTDGTGLGLYIAKAIVEAHHGKIWFESEENKGTTFFFTLPTKLLPETAVKEDKEKLEEKPPAHAVEAPTKPKKVSKKK